MRQWWVKCALQSVLGRMPGGERLHHNVLRRRKIAQEFDWTSIEQAVGHVEALGQQGVAIRDATVFEIGSGWKPLHGLVFRIAGCREVLLSDLRPHLTRDYLVASIRQAREYAPRIAAMMRIDEESVRAVLPEESGRNFSELLEGCGFHYRSPLDARNTGLPDESIDIITSRAVLAYIPPDVLSGIFREFRRIIKGHGAMVHTIDTSDSFSHADASISAVNFLRFSDRWWQFIAGNPLAYHNRLRCLHFNQMVEESGFRITHLVTKTEPRSLEALQTMRIAEDRFRQLTNEQLAISRCSLVARPSSTGASEITVSRGPRCPDEVG